MLKVAVIFESSPFDRKGLFNAAHNRILNLKAIGGCEIDAYCINSWDTAFTRKVRHTPVVDERCEVYSLDGVDYRMLWYDFSIIDHVTVEKLHMRPFFFSRFMKKVVPDFSGYDIVLAHSFVGGLFAYEISQAFGIPYAVTWHGSDIHTHPWRNPLVLNGTREVMKKASCNCFVSSALLSESDKILAGVRKEIFYNGVSDSFKKLSDSERIELRKRYGVNPDDKVVAFVGSIVEVKNVRSLQPLFHEIRSRYQGNLKFWMVGDGKLRDSVETAIDSDSSIDVRFWGNVPAEDIPLIMNCIDVMVLPSFNEGLPLVCAEAVRCGAAVLGSAVGGVPEVIGYEYTVSLGDGFIDGMASKAVEILSHGAVQSVPDALDWKITAKKEMDLILSMA